MGVGTSLLALAQPFSDGLPQVVDRFPYFVLIVLAAAIVYRWLRSR
jgi:hypothetical protein